jgi:hypothetical protein
MSGKLVRVSVLALLALAFVAGPVGAQEITSANWGEKVGFKPDLSGTPAVGTTIDKDSLDKWKKWIPDGIDALIQKYAMKFKITEYKPIHPSRGYIAATNQYLGQPQIVPNKNPRKMGITGYTAGLPFPNPQTGEEVAYNYHFAYFGDDGGFHYGVYWISAKSGVERSEEWVWEYITRVQFRTDLEPIPAIPELAKDGIAYRSMTWAIAPQDKRGFAALYSRMVEPKDQQGWIYLPPTRRTLRMSFGTRGDAWNSTDLLYEDVRGFMGYPEWMNWKLVAKTTMLAPMHSKMPTGKEALKTGFDFKTWPYWNIKAEWEPRPVYVVEATPRLADYPYSKMTFYFDAETFYIPVKVAYDKKGDLWKVVINAFNDSPDMDKAPPGIGTSLVVDLQSEHATAFPAYDFYANVGLDPNKFTLTNLKKMGK